jgi:hypothetical protein
MEDHTMKIRPVPSLVLSAVLASTAFGCSNQSVGPSSLGVMPAGGSAGIAPAASATDAASPARFGSKMPGVVYVTSQGLYYDTFVVKDPLPMEGRFQLIVNGTTEFGPGQPGYLGGRWWEDSNGNRVQDPGDHYFLCPLLPPGRPTP